MTPDSSKLTVSPYRPSNGSRLDPHEGFIARMRQNAWPLNAIAERLREECGVRIGTSALHEFCQRRKITKGSTPDEQQKVANRKQTEIDPLEVLRPRKEKTGGRYEPPSGPLRTRSNGLLKDE